MIEKGDRVALLYPHVIIEGTIQSLYPTEGGKWWNLIEVKKIHPVRGPDGEIDSPEPVAVNWAQANVIWTVKKREGTTKK